MTQTVKNVGGAHMLPDGSIIEHKGTFEYDGDIKELQRRFPNKFEAVVLPTATPTPTPSTDPEPKEPVVPEVDPVDVTEEFPTAGENDLTVVKDKAGWWVLDDDKRVNEKPLRKKDVADEIDRYLNE